MSGFAPAPTYPVAEVFGPTIQGEGPLAGMPTHFVRLGGCDYLCEWCDSLHAVLPEHVKKLDRLNAHDIAKLLADLPSGPQWVTLSGGNPGMFKRLDVLQRVLHQEGWKLSVETQGSKWQEWLSDIDMVVVSPKPPSSGMASDEHAVECSMFMLKLREAGARYAIKIVVFDEADYEWAVEWLTVEQGHDAYLSCGTDAQGQEDVTGTLARYAWLASKVANDDRLSSVRVLPQLHVLAWGHVLGV